MNHKDFVYWLQGYFEVADPKSIGEKETEMIKRHLALCFDNVTKSIDLHPTKIQDFHELVPLIPIKEYCQLSDFKFNHTPTC